ncbi:hypothetical protein P5757_03005 [Bacillus tropicus]|nr:hypothetical protein [Bacillus tropicus]MDF9587752.1 hypothetical protein [Bacillus tropicus]MDF9646727.1 hypothetical protein [Bacillus tropicus]
MQNIDMVLVDADAYTVKAENCASWNEFHVKILSVTSYAYRLRK